MKTTMILAALCGCSLAASSNMRWGKRQTGPSQDQVVAAIDRWNSDVAIVNNFLNTPPTTGAAYANFASFTLGFANDEPTQLMNLITVFGGVLTNLQDIINNQNDIATINTDVANINQIRCCNVLPDLDVLWTAAADDESVSNQVNLVVPGENACATITW